MEDYYLMGLSQVEGIGRKKIFELLKVFKDPLDIWNAPVEALEKVKGVTPANARSIQVAWKSISLDNMVLELKQKEMEYISFFNPKFPRLLKEINDPPVGIYVKGTLPPDDLETVGVIGARRCSSYGSSVAYRLAKDLAKVNVIVISGMATGIDSQAHKGTIDGGGKTIAVLGCGLDICYPAENKALMEKIVENGCVISEYPPGTVAIPANFPVRNRIISGLSRMIIVVEAAKRSGTMITADQALENGREVFVVPGNVTSNLSAGTNELIRQGCPIITNYEDVLFELGITYNDTEKKQFTAQVKKTLSPEEAAVYQYISSQPISAEEIARKSGKPVQGVLYAISLLELYGHIRKLPQSGYVKEG